MRYEIELKPRAIRDLKSLDRTMARRIVEKLAAMQDNLAGDVKRLTNSLLNFVSGSAIIGFYSKLKAIKC